MLCDLQKNLDEQKLKFKRCENTVGKINYKELGYNNCKSFEKNRKWIDHDEQLQFSRKRSSATLSSGLNRRPQRPLISKKSSPVPQDYQQ